MTEITINTELLQECIACLKTVRGQFELTNELLVIDELPQEIIDTYSEDIKFIDNEGVDDLVYECLTKIENILKEKKE